MSQVPQAHVRTPSPAASASQAQAQPSPLPSHSVGPTDQSDVEYIEVSETKVEPADYVEDDDQYSRDDMNDEDISMSASDPLSSSSQMLVPPPLMAGPSTSRDGGGKEALQGKKLNFESCKANLKSVQFFMNIAFGAVVSFWGSSTILICKICVSRHVICWSCWTLNTT